MPHIAAHIYECPETRKIYRTGLLLPKRSRKNRKQAGDVMPVYDRATILAKLKAAGGSIALAVGLPPSNQNSHPLCWDWSKIQMVEVALLATTGKVTRLDVSIAPVEDGCLNDGNDVDAAWIDGLLPYGVCPAAFMGTDPCDGGQLPDMLTSLSQFPAGWQAEAAKRKGVQEFVCPDFLTMASAIINGHPCNIGVDWQGGGHAIGCTEIGLTSNGGLYMATPGTWGLDFTSGWGSYPGKPGYYKLTESQTGAAWGGYGCQAIIGVKDDEDAPQPAAK